MFSWYPVFFCRFCRGLHIASSHQQFYYCSRDHDCLQPTEGLGLISLHVFAQWYTHTHTHPFNRPFSDLDFTEARDSEWQWHQLDHMQVCISLQTDNHASTPPLKFFTGRMPFLPPNQQRQSTEGNMWTLVRQQWCRDVCSMNMNVIIELISRLVEWLDFTSTLKYWAHCT